MKKIFSVLAVFALAICSLFTFSQNNFAKANNSDFDCEYYGGAIDFTTNLHHYGASAVNLLTDEEATAQGVPTGFSGDVLQVVELTNAISKGVLLDFSAQKIPLILIDSITFRIYVEDDGVSNGYPCVRIPKPNLKDHWTINQSIDTQTDRWLDFTVRPNNGDGYIANFNEICADGYLDKFEFAIRHSVLGFKFYIDSIKVNLIENDGVGPVINYVGEDELTISQGQELFFNVTATDKVDGAVEVKQVWGDESKLDENGKPTVGTHTLTFTATDIQGNVSTKTITINVVEPDLTAPTFNLPATEIHAIIGATPLIKVTATDDRDATVSVTYSWSEGALDKKGALTEGTHVLTITAKDLSNNTTVKTITFIVSEDGLTSDNVIDEEELSKEDKESTDESVEESIVDSEDESVIESVEESIVDSEDESVIESVEESIVDSEEESASESTVESTPTVESEVASNEEPSAKTGCGGAVGSCAVLSILALIGGYFIKKRS